MNYPEIVERIIELNFMIMTSLREGNFDEVPKLKEELSNAIDMAIKIKRNK